jgi:drug/metabolite transporter (DMT)-like permease
MKVYTTMNFYFLLVIAMIIWGGSWAFAKEIANMTSPLVIIFWRNLATFLALLPALFFLKEKPKFNYKSLQQGGMGAVIMTAYNYLFFLGLETGLAGAGGVLVTTLNPIFNFVLVAILYGKKISIREVFGLSLGFLAGLVLLHVWNLTFEEIYRGGNLIFLVASLTWAFLSIQTQRSAGFLSPVSYSFLVYGFSTLLSFFWILHLDWLAPLAFGFVFWGNLFYLAVISTAFATTVYFIASSHLGSHKASGFIFIVPASAVLSSWLILGEIPSWNTLLGGTMALGAARILHTATPKLESEKMD